MATNEQPDGILLALIRYALNIATVVGGLALVGGLLFILVTRANPEVSSTGGEEVAAQATPAQPTPIATPPASATETSASSAANPELLAMGKELFQSQECGACHTIQGVAQGMVGPNLTDIGVRAEARAKEAGVADAAAYIRQSIVDPNAYIASECPTGPCPPGTMPQTFGKMLSEEQIEALVQYLLAQKGGE